MMHFRYSFLLFAVVYISGCGSDANTNSATSTPPSKSGAPLSNIPSKNKQLIQAVKEKDAERVKILLSQGANPNTRDDSARPYWKRQLDSKIQVEDEKTHKFITRTTAQIEFPNTIPTYLGPTALMIAAHNGDIATVKVLITSKANLEVKGVDYGAAKASKKENIYDLFSHVTPFMEAMFSGGQETMRLLLANGANVNAKDSKGLTALNHAQNMVPTVQDVPAERRKYLKDIFLVLKEAGAHR